MIPTPPDINEQRRAREHGKRRAILEGAWSDLLGQHLRSQLGEKRAAMVGIPDISSNQLKQLSSALAVMYDRAPAITREDGSTAEDMVGVLDNARMWLLAQRNQLYTIGINDSVMACAWSEAARHAKVRVVPPDHVWGIPDAADDGQFGVIFEARERPITIDGRQRTEWVWDVWDMREPEEPVRAPNLMESLSAQRPFFRVLSSNLRSDLTIFAGIDPDEWSGSAYKYRDNGGMPQHPYTAYHALPRTGLWSATENSEVVFGTLQDGLNWTNTNHAFMRASWDARYVAGGKIVGGKPVGPVGDGMPAQTLQHMSDPTVITRIQADGDGEVKVGAWSASVDIDKAERFSRNYGCRLAVHFGLTPSDVTFDVTSPASGVSLTVSRKAVRRLQAKYAQLFRSSDLLMLKKIAIITNTHSDGPAVPQDGYLIEYSSVELSEEERTEILGNIAEEMKLGLVSRVKAYMRLNPGISEDQARVELLDILQEIADENQPSREPSPPQPPGDDDESADPEDGAETAE